MSKKNPNHERLEPLALTVDEAAALLKICRQGLYSAIRRGEFPAIKVGRCLRVPRLAVEQLLNGSLTKNNGKV